MDEHLCDFVFGDIEFPAHGAEHIEKAIQSGSVDIPCRIYLKKPPCEEAERLAKEKDGSNYSPGCFFLEALAGRDGSDLPWQTSNWFLFYVLNEGEWVLIDDSFELLDAWDYLKKEYERLKEPARKTSLATLCADAEARRTSTQPSQDKPLQKEAEH